MEETYYTNVSKDRRGECHANEAADRLAQLVKQAKNRVQLAAMDPDSTSRGRYRRMVAVKVRGKWHDLGRILIKEGHALFLSSSNEWAWNRSYSTIAQQAATRPLNLWNPEYCNPGPPVNLRMWANSDAEGASTRT
jgi:endonuclease YncB( thermonuclease family)